MYYAASAGSVHSVVAPATPMTAIPVARPATYYQAPMSAVLPGQAYYPSSQVSYQTYPASAGVVYQQQVAYAQPTMVAQPMMQPAYTVPTLVLPAHKRRRHRSRSGFLGYL
ncbi:hypothetical protein CVT24_013403 [Panaeolus cyanescens]|uniref:Uncharacterized protein n=1 Tax=Panaeolus cyanescens TaxID=181874 RepID=A0A409YMQ8_9AGAR|nr:hypothetical protein CVT24_013403 [Panaeolus cyanescens]